MLAHEVLAHLKSTLQLRAIGDPVGNLSLARGQHGAAATHIAMVENRLASGAIGVRECDKLTSLFTVVAAQKTPLLLYLDSAGARISEGLPALAAFRRMYRAALTMAASGAPFTVVCGANCYGGASMLAALAGTRFFAANTRLAMSGPAILAQSAGVSVLDEAFQAMSAASIGADARVKLADGNLAANAATLTEALPPAQGQRQRHAALSARLDPLRRPARINSDKVERKDLAKLYPDGYLVHEEQGVLKGEARVAGEHIGVLGIINAQPLGALRAWALADLVWNLHATPPKTLHMLVDCDAHAASLDDERVMLSVYLADLAASLHGLAQRGTRIETTVLGKLGGGVYVALAAPAAQVNVLYGKEIQLLPGKAIASILGDVAAQSFSFADYQKAGVAECELKLGILE